VKVMRCDSQGFVRLLGTCDDFQPRPQPGQFVQVSRPAPEFGECPVWGPLACRIHRWPVARTHAGETVIVAQEGAADPSMLPGWSPAP
jgi:hypothetical protein